MGKTVVVVCHGGVIEGSFAYFMGFSTFQAPRIDFYPHNTSITHWQRWLRADGMQYWRLVGYNDYLHLRDLGVNDVRLWEKMSEPAAVGEDDPSVPLPTKEERD
jgi:probable phosphoglycerate mutase